MSEMGLIVVGAAGRMGRTLVRVVSESSGARVVGAVERPGSPELGKDCGALAGIATVSMGYSVVFGVTLGFGITLIGRAFADANLAVLGDTLHRASADVRLGATAARLDQTPPLETTPSRTIEVAVVGAHLTGQPLNGQLQERNARLKHTTRTATGYSFYALANTKPLKPGLVFDGRGAGKIELEIWEMDERSFGSFVALIPAPLGIGTLRLEDGTSVKGFLCEAYAVGDAEDITKWGGWRAWLASR